MAADIETIIRRVVRDELNRSRPSADPQAEPKQAYTVQSMSDAYEVSVSYLRNEIRVGNLRPKYLGRKPLIGIEEADRWFASLPDDPPAT